MVKVAVGRIQSIRGEIPVGLSAYSQKACAVLGTCLDRGSLGPTFGSCRRPEGRAAAAASASAGQGRSDAVAQTKQVVSQVK